MTEGLWKIGFSLLGASLVYQGVKNIQDTHLKQRKFYNKHRAKKGGCLNF